MSIISDMSDEGLVMQFGDLMHELPELYEALRRWEIKSRPAVTSGGFKMRVSGQSVERGRRVLRLKIGHSGSVE
nr:hypothetical protein RP007_02572 [Rhizobium sp. P007]